MKRLSIFLFLFSIGCSTPNIASPGVLYVVGVTCYTACPWLASGATADTTATNDADVARSAFIAYGEKMIAVETASLTDPNLKTDQDEALQLLVGLWAPGEDIETALTMTSGQEIEFFITTDGKK